MNITDIVRLDQSLDSAIEKLNGGVHLIAFTKKDGSVALRMATRSDAHIQKYTSAHVEDLVNKSQMLVSTVQNLVDTEDAEDGGKLYGIPYIADDILVTSNRHVVDALKNFGVSSTTKDPNKATTRVGYINYYDVGKHDWGSFKEDAFLGIILGV